MAVTHTEADATAATAMTNAVADIEQETPEIGKERQLAGVGTGAGAGFVSDFVSLGVSSFFKGAESSEISFESEAINAFGSFGRS